MAKARWARLTKPIRPMVTDRPTETMNSTMPAATPPSTMLATSTPKITGWSAGCGEWLVAGARPDLQLLAGIFHAFDLADHLLAELAIAPHHHLREVFVHDDVAGHRIDHDRPARAVERPALERSQRLVGVDLALEFLHHVHDRGHGVVAAD